MFSDTASSQDLPNTIIYDLRQKIEAHNDRRVFDILFLGHRPEPYLNKAMKDFYIRKMLLEYLPKGMHFWDSEFDILKLQGMIFPLTGKPIVFRNVVTYRGLIHVWERFTWENVEKMTTTLHILYDKSSEYLPKHKLKKLRIEGLDSTSCLEIVSNLRTEALTFNKWDQNLALDGQLEEFLEKHLASGDCTKFSLRDLKPAHDSQIFTKIGRWICHLKHLSIKDCKSSPLFLECIRNLKHSILESGKPYKLETLKLRFNDLKVVRCFLTRDIVWFLQNLKMLVIEIQDDFKVTFQHGLQENFLEIVNCFPTDKSVGRIALFCTDLYIYHYNFQSTDFVHSKGRNNYLELSRSTLSYNCFKDYEISKLKYLHTIHQSEEFLFSLESLEILEGPLIPSEKLLKLAKLRILILSSTLSELYMNRLSSFVDILEKHSSLQRIQFSCNIEHVIKVCKYLQGKKNIHLSVLRSFNQYAYCILYK